ncbi:MAG: rod shape-determining protein MreC [Kiritimatiellia bacterium]
MKQSKLWIWILVVSVGALMFWQVGVRNFSRELLYPYESACLWFDRTVSVRFRSILSRSNNAAQNLKLKREVALLRISVSDADAREQEILRLRQALDFKPVVKSSWVAASVLSRGGTSAVWQSIRVAKGSRHGVRKGDPVVVPEGIVGRVAEVSAHTSEILLITDPNSRVACELETPTSDTGVVRGILYGGGARPGGDPELTLLYVVDPLRLRYLARDFNPAPHTRVISSGLGHTFPKGLLIGYLLESRLEPNGLSREATIVPAVDMAALEVVFILSTKGGARAQ